MKTSARKKIIATPANINSPEMAAHFRVLAAKFTAKATASREAAQAILQREGIVNAKGELTEYFAAR